MPPVTLHGPAEGLDRGDTYSGPNEEWLIGQGLASRTKGEDGLHLGPADHQKDPTLPENREAPDEEIPRPKGELRLVDHDPEAYKSPEIPEATDTTQPRQKVIDKMRAEVEDGKRDPNAPNVVLADATKAREESRDYDGAPVTEIQKRQAGRAEVEFKANAERDQKTRAAALKASAQFEKDNDMGGGTAPDEDRVVEDGVGTDAETQNAGEPKWPLLPELGPNVTVGKEPRVSPRKKAAESE